MKPLLNIWLNAGLNLTLHLLTLSLPNEAKGKFLKAERFHLNGHIIGFGPQTHKFRVALQNSIILSGSERAKEPGP